MASLEELDAFILTNEEKKRLRDRGRDAYYASFGKDREGSLERAAMEAKGPGARRQGETETLNLKARASARNLVLKSSVPKPPRRDLDDYKRKLCNTRFQQLPRARQVELCPEYEKYHKDQDARRQSLELQHTEQKETARPSLDVVTEKSSVSESSAAVSKQKQATKSKLVPWSSKKKRSRREIVQRFLQLIKKQCTSSQETAAFFSQLLKRACAKDKQLQSCLLKVGVSTTCRCEKLTQAMASLSKEAAIARAVPAQKALGRALIAAGFRTRTGLHDKGIAVSKRSWKMAKHGIEANSS